MTNQRSMEPTDLTDIGYASELAWLATQRQIIFPDETRCLCYAPGCYLLFDGGLSVLCFDETSGGEPAWSEDDGQVAAALSTVLGSPPQQEGLDALAALCGYEGRSDEFVAFAVPWGAPWRMPPETTEQTMTTERSKP